MQIHLSLRFKTKYLGPGKVDTFIDLMSFFTSSTVPAPMTRHGFSGTRPGQSNIGFTGLSLMGSPGYGRANEQGVRVGSLPQSCRSWEMKSSGLPGNWDTTKTSGMVCCCLITLRRTTPFHSVCGNAKGYSTNLDLVSRGLDARPAKPIHSSGRPSKKLLPMDERPHHPALVRGRSPFPAAQQPDKDVGAEGTTASCALAFSSSQSGLLRGAQLENWMPADQGSSNFQCRDLWRLCPLSSPIYSGETIPYSGQCQMAQSTRFERPLPCKSGTDRAYLPAAIFPRTQSSGTSMEDHSPASNPRSLFPIGGGTQNSFNFSFYEMGATQ
jgi:hypothetical protein